jgi:hypothetical protein
MMESRSARDEAMLAEFQALREETMSCINERVWGVATYAVIAAGVIAGYSGTHDPNLLVLFVLAALPLMWHASLRERSRIRIGSYIRVFLEKDINGKDLRGLEGLYWEHAVKQWRERVPSNDMNWRRLDRLGHIFSLTGIYVLGSVGGLYALSASHPNADWQRAVGMAGCGLLGVAHAFLYRFYSSSEHYYQIFAEIRDGPTPGKASDPRGEASETAN